jgi:hypothetical protein
MKSISKVWVGILLTGVVWIVSACVILFIMGGILPSANPIAVDDGSRNLKFVASICAIIFSFAYFWRFRQQSKGILRLHFLVTFVLLLYFGCQYLLIRREQHQVLMMYQEFRQAVLDEDYQRAYELMSPDWRNEHSVNDMKWETEGFLDLGPEDSVYSVHASAFGRTAIIVPSPNTSWWYRASAGSFRSFEKVGSEWFVSPRNIDFYLANP